MAVDEVPEWLWAVLWYTRKTNESYDPGGADDILAMVPPEFLVAAAAHDEQIETVLDALYA